MPLLQSVPRQVGRKETLCQINHSPGGNVTIWETGCSRYRTIQRFYERLYVKGKNMNLPQLRHFCIHTHQKFIRGWTGTAYFWSVGRGQSTCGEPTWEHGEHANAIPGSKTEASVLTTVFDIIQNITVLRMCKEHVPLVFPSSQMRPSAIKNAGCARLILVLGTVPLQE